MPKTLARQSVKIPDLAVLLAEMVSAALAEGDRLLARHPEPAR